MTDQTPEHEDAADDAQPVTAPPGTVGTEDGRDLADDHGTPVVTEAQAQSASLAAPAPDAAPPASAQVTAGRVIEPWEDLPSGSIRLAPVPPLTSVTLPPLEDGGEGIVIGEDGIVLDGDTARRAVEAATRAGLRLQELQAQQ